MFCCFSLDGCCHLVSSGWKSSSSFVIQMVSPVNQTTCLHYSSVRNAMKRSPPLLSLVIDVARKETRNKCRRRRRMTLRQSSDLWLPNKQRLQHGSHYIVPLYIPPSFLELWQVANEQHWRVKEKKEAFFFTFFFATFYLDRSRHLQKLVSVASHLFYLLSTSWPFQSWIRVDVFSYGLFFFPYEKFRMEGGSAGGRNSYY